MNKIAQILKEEKAMQLRNGLYGLTQRSLAYNSNRIEGSTLTEEDTYTLFNSGKVYNKDSVYVAKDIEEMTGHFAMFNYMLDTYDNVLDDKIIKQYHKMLKQGVFEDIANGYAIGEYKTKANVIGYNNIKTSSPDNVEKDINELLNWYKNQEKITINILALFHIKYETIHPFQDGNGRTGRMILFKECLKNNIIPIIIQDKNKLEYYEGLKNAKQDNIDTLINLFKKEQDWYKNELNKFDENLYNNEKTEEENNEDEQEENTSHLTR